MSLSLVKILNKYDEEDFYDRVKIDEEFKEWIELESEFNFWVFCVYMDYEFFTERKDIFKSVAKAMQKIADGELRYLYIGMPPRAGKSYIATLFSCWLLGRNPNEAIMRNTVTNKLYKKFSKDAINIMKGETHNARYRDVFSGIMFATENIEEGWTLVKARTGISYFGAGVGGTVIGFGATKCAILDDSIKDVEEAMSQTMLDKKWNWYTGVHQSRMEKGCPEIHIATRWSKDDIPGKLIQENIFTSDEGKKIVIPALDKNGETFCDEVHSTEYYQKKKDLTPQLIWEAEYMQSPIEAKGLLFASDDLNRFEWDSIKNRQPDSVIFFCDTADTGDDYLSCPIGWTFGKDVYVTDVAFTQEQVEITEPLVTRKIINNQVETGVVESNKDGRQFARNIRRLLKDEDYYCNVKDRHESRNKETRILMQSGYIKKYFHFLASEEYKEGSQYAKFIEQITSYSKQGDNKHDDAPDSLAGMTDMVRNDKKAGTW